MFLFSFIVLTLVYSVGFPFYNRYRSKMKAKVTQKFSTIKIFKHVAINQVLNLFILLFLFSNLEWMLRGSLDHGTNVLFLILFITSISTASFGSGMYVTSIIIDSYTLPRLRKYVEFKVQFIAEHLFHGVLSHSLVYCSYISSFLFLSLYEISIPLRLSDSNNLLLFAGMVFGFAFAVSQIQIDTHLYPFMAAVIACIIMAIVVKGFQINVLDFRFSSYYLGFLTGEILTNIVNFLNIFHSGRNIYFDRKKF